MVPVSMNDTCSSSSSFYPTLQVTLTNGTFSGKADSLPATDGVFILVSHIVPVVIRRALHLYFSVYKNARRTRFISSVKVICLLLRLFKCMTSRSRLPFQINPMFFAAVLDTSAVFTLYF